MLFARVEVNGDDMVVGCWSLMEGDLNSCGLEMEMVLVVCELLWRSYVRRCKKGK